MTTAGAWAGAVRLFRLWVELTAIMQIGRRTALIPAAMSLLAEISVAGEQLVVAYLELRLRVRLRLWSFKFWHCAKFALSCGCQMPQDECNLYARVKSTLPNEQLKLDEFSN